MKKCYCCLTSFAHEGDPIDGNEFCNHKCSALYIEWVNWAFHIKKSSEHFKNLPLGMKSDVYRMNTDGSKPLPDHQVLNKFLEGLPEDTKEKAIKVFYSIRELSNTNEDFRTMMDRLVAAHYKIWEEDWEEKKVKKEAKEAEELKRFNDELYADLMDDTLRS